MRKAESSRFDSKRIMTFIIISYAISWIIWMPKLLSHHFYVSWFHSDWLHILGGFGPFLGATITTLIYDKTRGVRYYFQERFMKNLKITLMFVGLSMPIMFFFITYILFGILL